MNATGLLSVTFLAAASLACGSEPAPQSTVSAASPAKTPAPAPASAGAPTPAPSSSSSAASGLAFNAQPGWVVEKPTSSMRKAQYRLPHAEGDGEDATLVVYYFGGGGGSVDANVERWTGQFEQPDGRPSAAVLQNAKRTVNGMTVHDVGLTGTYVAETTPGSGERVRKEGWRMLAAILEAPDGPYYAKVVGPAATVAHWEASFQDFVAQAKPGG